MAAAAETRIMKELAEVSKDDGTSGVTAVVAPNDSGSGGGNRHLLGKIMGPQGTVYEGGLFEIDIVIPKPYPFEPPKVRDIEPVFSVSGYR
jgi:ubiquitin-conjugating enzyme (huntingtin interacting protein 2)